MFAIENWAGAWRDRNVMRQATLLLGNAYIFGFLSVFELKISNEVLILALIKTTAKTLYTIPIQKLPTAHGIHLAK